MYLQGKQWANTHEQIYAYNFKKIKINYAAEIKLEGQIYTEYFKKLISQKVV